VDFNQRDGRVPAAHGKAALDSLFNKTVA
jgi:hypothetical protein